MGAATVAAAGVLVMALAGSVVAHSLLLESSPAAGVTLTDSPPQISLRFNNRIEKKLSTIRVLDERGASRPVTVLVADGPAERLTAALPPLAIGSWRVEWQVLSTDGHIVRGSFSFRIAR